MQAYVEVIKFNVNDVVTASGGGVEGCVGDCGENWE